MVVVIRSEKQKKEDIMELIEFSVTTYFLIVASLVALIMILVDSARARMKKTSKDRHVYDSEVPTLPEAPGPKPWPILGSLHLLGKYEVPYMAFGELAKTYSSQVIKLRMGSVPCVVVNGLENIKEVLITKGHQFDSRPNFSRYHRLFCGDKENCKHHFRRNFINFFLPKRVHARVDDLAIEALSTGTSYKRVLHF